MSRKSFVNSAPHMHTGSIEVREVGGAMPGVGPRTLHLRYMTSGRGQEQLHLTVDERLPRLTLDGVDQGTRLGMSVRVSDLLLALERLGVGETSLIDQMGDKDAEIEDLQEQVHRLRTQLASIRALTGVFDGDR